VRVYVEICQAREGGEHVKGGMRAIRELLQHYHLAGSLHDESEILGGFVGRGDVDWIIPGVDGIIPYLSFMLCAIRRTSKCRSYI
jgi:hypothetical protein